MSINISGRIYPSGGVNMLGNSIVEIPGQIQYTTPGTYSFVVPGGTTNISIVTIGGGGGGFGSAATGYKGGAGGGLAYVNNVSVTPGETLTVIVGVAGGASAGVLTGGTSRVRRSATDLCAASGGTGGNVVGVTARGLPLVGTGSLGGYGTAGNSARPGGGGGAGGYLGSGGSGGPAGTVGGAGLGGAGGGGSGSTTTGGRGYAGGGVGLLGIGSNGTAVLGHGGGGGSGGTAGGNSIGGSYGGGGGGALDASFSLIVRGGTGAVRILWGGGRSFPHNAADV